MTQCKKLTLSKPSYPLDSTAYVMYVKKNIGSINFGKGVNKLSVSVPEEQLPLSIVIPAYNAEKNN